MQANRGFISVRSAPQGGTAFTLRFGISERPPSPVQGVRILGRGALRPARGTGVESHDQVVPPGQTIPDVVEMLEAQECHDQDGQYPASLSPARDRHGNPARADSAAIPVEQKSQTDIGSVIP